MGSTRVGVQFNDRQNRIVFRELTRCFITSEKIVLVTTYCREGEKFKGEILP